MCVCFRRHKLPMMLCYIVAKLLQFCCLWCHVVACVHSSVCEVFWILCVFYICERYLIYVWIFLKIWTVNPATFGSCLCDVTIQESFSFQEKVYAYSMPYPHSCKFKLCEPTFASHIPVLTVAHFSTFPF